MFAQRQTITSTCYNERHPDSWNAKCTHCPPARSDKHYGLPNPTTLKAGNVHSDHRHTTHCNRRMTKLSLGTLQRCCSNTLYVNGPLNIEYQYTCIHIKLCYIDRRKETNKAIMWFLESIRT